MFGNVDVFGFFRVIIVMGLIAFAVGGGLGALIMWLLS